MNYDHTWINEYDLVGQNAAWLRSACRERGLPTGSRAKRADLIARLIEHKNNEGVIVHPQREGGECAVCERKHPSPRCPKWAKMNPQARLAWIEANKRSSKRDSAGRELVTF